MQQKDLQLIKNENFNGAMCGFYRENGSNEVYLSREQIGEALGYSDPRNSIMKIHSRHADRLDALSVRVPIEKVWVGDDLSPTPNGGTGGEKETVLYSRVGVFEICRWSNKPKAHEFIDFVWRIADGLVGGKLALVSQNRQSDLVAAELNRQFGVLSNEIITMQDNLSSMSGVLDEMNERTARTDKRIGKVEKSTEFSNYYMRLQFRSGYNSNWEKSHNGNVRAVAQFLGVPQKKLLSEIYKEMENRYGVKSEKFAADYKKVRGISTCSMLTVISYSLTLREMFNAILRQTMEECGINNVSGESQTSTLSDMIERVKEERYGETDGDGVA